MSKKKFTISGKNSAKNKETMDHESMDEKLDQSSVEDMEVAQASEATSDHKAEAAKKVNEEIIKKMEELLNEQKQQYDAKLKLCENKMKEMHVDKLSSLEQQKKQYLIEIEDVKKYALQKFIEDLLTVADNLQLASMAQRENYEQFMSGLNMTINIFNNTLKKYKVEEIPVKIGDTFNESIHECLGVSGDGTQIVQILKPGYKYGDRVIRAVQVIVGKIS